MNTISSRAKIKSLLMVQDLPLDQKAKMLKALFIISKYMIVNRDMLDSLAGEKIGLSFIKRAIDYDLIVEINSKDDSIKDCFYMLGMGGCSLLELDNIEFNSFKLTQMHEEYNKVLMFNNSCIENNCKLLFSKYNDLNDYNFFHTKNKTKDTIFYFEDFISKKRVTSAIKSIFVRSIKDSVDEIPVDREALFEEFIAEFDFKTIELIDTGLKENSRNSRFYEYDSSNLRVQRSIEQAKLIKET